jgi:hypothetical protein
MIKTTKLSTLYRVEDPYTENEITVEVSPNKLRLIPKNGKPEFVFNTDNTKETRARWRNVAKLIIKACDLV